jgi:prepilin-type N-terminal cleavage/methylation domain-containing protein
MSKQGAANVREAEKRHPKEGAARRLNLCRGFSLLELSVVIAIIIVLAAVVVPSGVRILERSRISALAVDIVMIKSAAIEYYADNGAWPQSEEGFTQDLVGEGSYLDRWPQAPWQGSLVTWRSEGPYVEVQNLPTGKSVKLQEILGGEVAGINYSLKIR